MLGLGHVLSQKWAYDQQYGVALARRFHHNKPPTILDAPKTYSWAAVELPDPETPTGIRGVGEPPVGAAYGVDHERTAGCDRRRGVPAVAGDARHPAGGDRERRQPDARTFDGHI